MFGTTSYQLSLIKTYVAHWGLAEAARELIQNALDGESPFAYSFEPNGESTWALRLNSEFAKLDPKTLLLGATSKTDNQDAIGSFGEGYKIALLVLTRLGFTTTIFNDDLVWRPLFKFNKTYGEELLTIEETRATDRTNKGLTFVVEGLDDADRSIVESCCLKMQDEIGQIKLTTFGDILVDRPGELYVGSLFVCKTDMQFGYNIKPQHLRLERDRQTVDGWDLATITRDMWYETKDFDHVAKMIFEEVPDLRHARYSSPEIVKEACYALFKERNPGALIAESPQQMKEMIEKGLVNTVFIGGSAYAAVSSSRSYRSENRQLVAIQSPHEKLTQWLSANRSEMRSKAIESFKKELLEASKKWKI